MPVPKVPTFDDWHFELVNLATGDFTNLDQSINNIAGWVARGATRHRLESAHLEIIDGTVGATALSWDGIQLLRIVPYADPTHELWGYIAKDKHRYTKTGLRDMIQVTVLPVEYLLHSRVLYETDNAAAPPVAIATEAVPNDTGADYAKTLLTACIAGRYPTAAAPDARSWNWGTLVVTAQTHEGIAVAPPMTLFGGFLDEAISALGITYLFDWELYVTVVAGALVFAFNTADSGGADLTVGVNRVIINDIGALVPAASRYFDRQGMINALHGGPFSTAVLDAVSIAIWGRWEGETQSSNEEEIALILNKSGIKEGSTFDFQASAASEQCQWMDEFEAGDTVIRNNIRLDITASNEIIQAIEFSFRERVLATRIRWGNKEQGNKDKQRQGKFTPFPPVSPTLWSRHALLAYLYPTSLGDDIRIKDAAGVDKFEIDGATGNISLHGNAETRYYDNGNYVGFEAGALGADQIWVLPLVDGGASDALITNGAGVLSWGVVSSSFWERGDLDSGGGVQSGLHTRLAGEAVMIGADDADLTATPWAGTSGGTKLDVRGLLRVVRGVYCNEASLALWGIDGGIPKVHIVDESAAVGGAGGGACQLDIFNAATRHHMFDADIANPSFVRGFFEIHDAAGAIGHTFNAISGVVTLNVQRLAAGDFSVLAQAGGVTILGTDASTRDLVLNNVTHRWPAADAAGSLISNGVGVLSWGAPAPAAHNLLSAIHGDTVVSAMTRGDLVVGTAGGWDDLAIGALSTHFESDGTDPSWQANITMADGATIGQAAGALLTFDDTNDFLELSGAKFGVGLIAPQRSVHASDGDFGQIRATGTNSAKYGGFWAENDGGAFCVLGVGGSTHAALPDTAFINAQNDLRIIANGTHIVNVSANFDTWNSADVQVYSDAGITRKANIDGATGRIDSVDGYTKSGAAANRHVMIGDGTRGVFRALVAADLPAAAQVWTDTGTAVRTTNANRHVIPNSGTGTLGLVGDRWDNFFGVLGNFTGDVTIANAVGIIHTGRITNGFVLRSNGTRFIGAALVAADLAGHVHVNTFGGAATGAGSNHSHPTSKTTQTGTFTVFGAIITTGNPVRDSGSTIRYIRIADNAAGLNARWEQMYIGAQPHRHADGTGDHTFTYGATNNESAHEHPYQQTQTPTQGPS